MIAFQLIKVTFQDCIPIDQGHIPGLHSHSIRPHSIVIDKLHSSTRMQTQMSGFSQRVSTVCLVTPQRYLNSKRNTTWVRMESHLITVSAGTAFGCDNGGGV